MSTKTDKALIVLLVAFVLFTAIGIYGCIKAFQTIPHFILNGKELSYSAVDSIVHTSDKPRNEWRSIISQHGDEWIALEVNDSLQDYMFIKPHEGRYNLDGDTSRLQIITCSEPQQIYVSTEDSAKIAVDRWNKIYH